MGLSAIEQVMKSVKDADLRQTLDECKNKHDILNKDIKSMLDSADDATLLSLVEQGLGVTVLPELAMQGHSAQVRTLPLDPPLRWQLGVVLPKTVNSMVREFVSFLIAQKQ